MKIFLKIGWRNLWRNKRRSLIVISSVALGVFSLILTMALSNDMIDQTLENTINTSLGHISVSRKGSQDDIKLKNSFIPPENLTNALDRIPAVVAAAPRLKIEAMLRSSEASRGVLVMGIDPVNEESVSKIADYLLPFEGNAFLDKTEGHDILLSKTLAEKLDLEIGDRVVLMFQDVDAEITGGALTVKGLYQSPIDSFDQLAVYTGIGALQELTGVGKGISEISVRLADRNQVDAVIEAIRSVLGSEEIEALTWKERAPYMLRVVALFDIMAFIIFAILFTIVVFSIANILIMSIMERFHEIGVMKSIGTRPFWIWRMVLFEAINLGIVGLIAGTVVGVFVTIVLSYTGIDLSFWIESLRAMGIGHIVYPVLKTLDIIMAVVIVFGTVVTAALYPAFKAARIKPLDALHFV